MRFEPLEGTFEASRCWINLKITNWKLQSALDVIRLNENALSTNYDRNEDLNLTILEAK
jgi:hypothetical protein